jgi:hypothetical protein
LAGIRYGSNFLVWENHFNTRLSVNAKIPALYTIIYHYVSAKFGMYKGKGRGKGAKIVGEVKRGNDFWQGKREGKHFLVEHFGNSPPRGIIAQPLMVNADQVILG